MKHLEALRECVNLTGEEINEETHTLINVGLVLVAVSNDAQPSVLVDFIAHMTKPGNGSFQDMTIEDLVSGPSYIALGTWIGDQSDALMYMAIGQHLGAWDVVTPETLGIVGVQAAEMMGQGFVMTNGISAEFKSLLDESAR